MKRNVTWLVIVVTCSSYLTLTQIHNTRRQAPEIDSTNHRRRIYIEEKANVVAAVRRTEFIQYLALPCLT